MCGRELFVSHKFAGSTEDNCFSSIEELNGWISKNQLCSGDKILFKRYETFIGTLHLKNVKCQSEKPLYIGAYGEGNIPPTLKAPPIENGIFSENNRAKVMEIITAAGKTPETYGDGNFDRPPNSEIPSVIFVEQCENIIIENLNLYSENDGVTYYSHWTKCSAILRFNYTIGITLRNLHISAEVTDRPKDYFADNADRLGWVGAYHLPYQGNDYYGLLIENSKDESSDGYDNVVIENLTASKITGMVINAVGFTVRNIKVYDSPAWGFSFTGAHGIVQNCETNHTGYGKNPNGNAAFMVVSSQDITFDGLKAIDCCRGPQNWDGVAFDFEGGLNQRNISLKNAVFDGIDGSAIMLFNNSDCNRDCLIENVYIKNYNRSGTTEGAINMCAPIENYPNSVIIRNAVIEKNDNLPYYTGYYDETQPLLEYPNVVFENCNFYSKYKKGE